MILAMHMHTQSPTIAPLHRGILYGYSRYTGCQLSTLTEVRDPASDASTGEARWRVYWVRATGPDDELPGRQPLFRTDVAPERR